MNRKQRRAAKAGASPVTADALNARGLVLVTTAPSDPATLAQAIESFYQAVRLQPDHVEALGNLGAALHSAGRDTAAVAACRRTLALDPTCGRAFYNLGIALKAQGRLTEAVAAYRRSLAVRPNDAETHNNLGNALIALDRPAEAEAAFRVVLSLNGEDPEAMNNLGVALQAQGLFEDGVAAYRHALAGKPDYVEAQANLSSALFEHGRFAEAIAEASLALEIQSDSAAAHNNLGVACQANGRLTEAVDAFRAALSLRQDFAEAHYNLATALLQAGQYAEGWREYEWRWRGGVANLVPRPFVEPRWAGEDLTGRIILLWAEQGLGDVLHFARGASLLAARGAKVVLEVYRPLARLMASVPGVARVVASGDTLPPFDYHLPLMSVPHLVGAGVIAADTPYIRADDGEAAKWQARLAGRPGLKVGLVWSGDPRPHDPRANAVDRRRSIRLTALSPLLTTSDVCFVSLQKGKPAAQLNDLPTDVRPLNWMDEIGDFADTAALVANLDLVISVDTSVAHLAGALGKPVWILSRFDGCWRWLEDRDDSPWYPSARLFRQEMPGAWDETIGRVVTELSNFSRRPRAGGDPESVPGWVPACAGTTKESGDTAIPASPAGGRDARAPAPPLPALFAQALRHHKAGEVREAEALYRRLLGEHPDHPPGLYNLGLLLLGQGRTMEAAPLIDRAIGLQPADPLAYYNLGFAYQSLGRSAEAAEAYRKSLALRPDNADARNNLGTVLLDMRQTGAAQAAFRAAINGRPDFAAAHYNLARALLLAGDYPAGWREYEWRWQSGATRLSPRPFRQSQWTGEDPAGRTILLHGEQGLGDVLQFARFATAVAALGARVVVEAQAPLVRLLASVPGIDQVVAADEPLPPFDLHLPLLSAPSVLGTTVDTIPATIPYVTPDPAAASAWRQRLAPLSGLKVGLVWAGAEGDDPEAAAVDRRRSLPLAALSPLLAIPGISFVSLQKGAAAAQIANLPEASRPRHWMDEIGDFADTAALVDGLDLVITVDTAVAHLAGGMGKPVWILSRFDGCWRWLEDRDDSPWYPTARLFRQKAPGAWGEVIGRVAAELDVLVRRPRAGGDPETVPDWVPACAGTTKKNDSEDLFPQAVAHHQAGRLAEAEGLYRRLIVDPGPAQAAAHSNLGVLYRQLGRMGEAAEHFRQATVLKADYAEAFNNLGLVHNDLGDAEAAVACYRRTLALAPDHPHALTNLGAALQDLRRIDEAMAAYRRALAVCPDLPGAHYNLGQALLLKGDYRQGWREYDWLWKGGFPVRPRNFTQPRWSGEDLVGRTILLYAEQGLGDVLHFVRYASVIAAMGGRVIVEVYPPLKRLLAGMAGVAEVVAQGEPLPPFDLHLPLMAAPGALGTTAETIPARPYVFADPTLAEAWRHRLAGLPGLKVGLVWAGEPRPGDLRAHVVDRRRSLALARLMPLLSVDGASFVSLQKGAAAAQIADLPKGSRPHHWMDEIGDFADTAALVDGLDLVITVDTSVAHLVGAMGKTVWILSRFDGCWRWLEDRDDTPWYPSARLFRQTAPGAWDEVIERVAAELRRLVESSVGRASRPPLPDGPAAPEGGRDARPTGSLAGNTVVDLFPQALAHHRAGRFEEAAGLYQRILENDPTHFDSLHHLGLIALWSGDAAAAVRWISLAILQDRRHAGAHDNLGLALAKAGRPNDAVLTFRMAIELDPERAEIYYHLGAVLHDVGRFDRAATAYRNALALRPDFGLAPTNLRASLHELSHAPDGRPLSCHPDDRREEGSPVAKEILRCAQDDRERSLPDLFAEALRHHQENRLDQAEELYRRILAIEPGQPVVLCHLGLIAHQREMSSAASALIRQAVTQSPTYVEAWSNLGIVLREMGSPGEAVVCFQRALQLRPDLAEPRNNLGGAYRDLGHLDDAISAFRAALALQPDHPEIHCNLAAALLERGDYEEGWREHEWRLHPNVHWTKPSPLVEPLWQGEDLNGRTILLRSEQGLGDDLQFARFAAPIAALGARVILEVPAALTRLLNSVPGVAQVVAKGEPLPPFDCHLSLMSVPSRLGTTLDTIPGQIPYLAPDPAQIAAWGKRLKRLPGLKVGLVWAGDPRPYDRRANAIDQRRSMRLRQFEPLLARPEISVVSLQKGAAAGQIAELPPELRPLDVMDEIADFADTAAMVANLDLVITVDTSVAHLAGAMGKPVWIASRFDGCWRWLSGRDDSPWYPTARLFRQKAPGDWDEVVARMVAALPGLAAAHSPCHPDDRSRPCHPDDRREEGSPSTGQILRCAQDDSEKAQDDREKIALADLFTLAVEHHQAGRLAQAEALYRRILAAEPGNVGSLFHLGLIAQQCGHHGAAIELFGQAIQRNDQVPGLHDSLGTSLAALGRLDEAIAAHRRAIGLKGDFVEALYNLGNALMAQGRHQPAIACFRQTLACRPDLAEPYNNLGNLFSAEGATEQAVFAFERAVQLAPGEPAVHNNLGNAYKDQERMVEAEACFRRALALAENYAEAHYNLANLFLERGDFAAATAIFRRVIVLRPDLAEAYNNLGSALHMGGRTADAVTSFHRVLVLDPGFPEAHTNLGSVHREQGEHDLAIAAYRHAIGLAPDYPLAHSNLAMVLLLKGDYDEGLKEFEWRRRSAPKVAARTYAGTPWTGQDLAGRSILLYAEQGLGDALQFARYAPILAAKGAKVVLEVYPPLTRLLATVPGVAAVVPTGGLTPAFDFHLSMVSLPHRLGTRLDSIPASVPYVSPDAEQAARWGRRLGRLPGLKVGLVWAGDPRPHDPHAHAVDRRRSMALSRMAPLLSLPGLSFVSLQKGGTAAQLEQIPAELRPLDPMDEIGDFADTAALVANLDLVISVDTSVVHLAGAMGRPVWILSRFDGCWRWLENRDDSPWYPSARLFRQRAPGNWDDVIERVAKELTRLT